MEENKNESEVITDEKPVEEEKTKPKKSKAGLIILLLILVILIVLAIVFIPSLIGKNGGSGSAGVDKPIQESPYRIKGNSLEAFDLYFLQLENKEKNTVYSPLSIKYALAMLNEGTDGLTHDQIANIIGDYKAKKYNNNSHMSFANAMYIRNTFKDNIKSEYTTKLKEAYGAEVFTEDFTSADPMNKWVSDKTFNLLNNLLDTDTVKGLDFILMNALAIDMNWTSRIQSAAAPLPEGMKQYHYSVHYPHEKYEAFVSSIDGGDDSYPKMTFNNVENTKSVEIGASFNHYDIIKELGEDNIRKTVTEKYEEFLASPNGAPCADTVEAYIDQYVKDLGSNYKKADISTEFSLYNDDEVKAFAKDLQTYDGTTLQYVAIMPKVASLKDYIKDINAESVSSLIGKLKEAKYDSFKDGVVTKIVGKIPLFKYEFEMNLIDELSELGVKNVFDESKADMSKMLKDTPGYISFAKHKAMIEFSNDGIKAAAATAMGGAGAASACQFVYDYEVPVETIDITFDKPYMYIIRDKDTGEVWFAGSVYTTK